MAKTRYKKSTDTQTRILDAAEELFAKQGYEATTTRQITTLAGVRSASVNYYFATKQALAVQVIDRRFDVLRTEREARLSAIDWRAGTPEMRLRKLIEAFVLPLAELTQTDEEGWGNYNRIMAQAAASGEWNNANYIEKVNASAAKFIDALHEINGGCSSSASVRAFELMLGSVLHHFARSNRLTADAHQGPRRADEDKLITFLQAGLFRFLSDAE